MIGMGRPGLSITEKNELWSRWKQGETLSDIGRALGVHAASVFGVLKHNGGVYQEPRIRARNALTVAEREEISRGISSNRSIREIAKTLDRSPSTISREISRNGGRKRYRAVKADINALRRGHRPKACKLAKNPKLCRIVARKLSINWSPEQISGWLKCKYPDNENLQVSHETIYRSLFIQARGVLKKELIKHLRSKRVIRRSKHATTKGQTRGQIIDAVSIRERPASVEDRAIPGHWEGDLISGSKNSHIATLVERQSRFTMLVKVDGKDTHTVTKALSKQIKKLPMALRQSLTWDRGTELAQHKWLTIDANIKVYFCDPQSPWQRGTNENTNRLLRQYFPKGTDLSVYSQSELNRIAKQLNQRPRKTLRFETPADKLKTHVAMTG